jgi:hypothetical protein
LSLTGSIDKAILEAMASGCLVLSSNDSFKTIAQNAGFSECVIEPNLKAIQDSIYRFKNMSFENLTYLSKKQSDVAMANHSLEGLISRLSSILKQNINA